MSFAVSSSSITCTVRVVAAKRATSDGPRTRRSLGDEGSSQGPQQQSSWPTTTKLVPSRVGPASWINCSRPDHFQASKFFSFLKLYQQQPPPSSVCPARVFLTSKISYLTFFSQLQSSPIKLETQTAKGVRLLIATHLDQSNHLANQQQVLGFAVPFASLSIFCWNTGTRTIVLSQTGTFRPILHPKVVAKYTGVAHMGSHHLLLFCLTAWVTIAWWELDWNTLGM